MSDDPERRVYLAAVDPGSPANDQAAAAARDDLDKHLESCLAIFEQGADDVAAMAVMARAFIDHDDIFPRGRLASCLAAALVRLGRLQTPESPDVPPIVRVGCPRAQNAFSPCIAREGAACLIDGACYGCDRRPEQMIAELAAQHPAARPDMGLTGAAAADALQRHVRSYLGMA